MILCDVPDRPYNGEIKGSGSGVDTVIDFTCHRGYEMIGDHRITCLPNATWSGKIPKCQGKVTHATWSGKIPKCQGKVMNTT